MVGGKVYPFEEVYDLTPFMEEHHGGDEVLLACTGKDATADFDDIGHTDSAKELMPQNCIGEVDASTVPAKLAYVIPMEAALTRGEGPGVWLTVLQLAVPVLLLALAFALENFAKTKT